MNTNLSSAGLAAALDKKFSRRMKASVSAPFAL